MAIYLQLGNGKWFRVRGVREPSEELRMKYGINDPLIIYGKLLDSDPQINWDVLSEEIRLLDSYLPFFVFVINEKLIQSDEDSDTVALIPGKDRGPNGEILYYIVKFPPKWATTVEAARDVAENLAVAYYEELES